MEENIKVKTKKKKDIDILTERIQDLEERLLRNQAELQNYKRRKEEEISRILKYSNEDFVRELLEIIDNFERAIYMDDDNLDDEVSRFLEGFKMIYGSLNNLLNEFEVKEIEALGKPFDPQYHQALLTDNDETEENEMILEVLQKGYMLKDKVIRPAMVKVNIIHKKESENNE
jgi:molecular chaperone GrpE